MKQIELLFLFFCRNSSDLLLNFSFRSWIWGICWWIR